MSRKSVASFIRINVRFALVRTAELLKEKKRKEKDKEQKGKKGEEKEEDARELLIVSSREAKGSVNNVYFPMCRGLY